MSSNNTSNKKPNTLNKKSNNSNKKANKISFATYIKKVAVLYGRQTSKGAIDRINELLVFLAKKILKHVNSMNIKTVDPVDIKTALDSCLVGQLKMLAIKECNRADSIFEESTKKVVREKILFSIPVVEKLIRATCPDKRVSKTAPACLAGVMDYMCAEILEKAVDSMDIEKEKRVLDKHVNKGIKIDNELSIVFKDMMN